MMATIPTHHPVRARSEGSVTQVEQLLHRVATHYHQALVEDPRAMAYVRARGITQESVDRWGLGYARAEWQGLQECFDDFDDLDVVASGLIAESPYGRRYDRFRDRIMFPIRRVDGAVVGFGGRRLDDVEEAADSVPKYLNSPATVVFDKGRLLFGLYEHQAAIRERGFAVVMEGYTDVIACDQAGFELGVATLGTALTHAHIAQLFELTSDVVFCFDGDSAGRKAAARALQVALPWTSRVQRVSFVFLEPGHDPDTLVREHGAQALEAVVAHAMSALEFAIQLACAGHDLASIEGRAHAAAIGGEFWALAGADDIADSLLHHFARMTFAGLPNPCGEQRRIWVAANGNRREER